MHTLSPRDVRRWIPSLYFGMGLPLIVIANMAGLMFKGLGVSDADNTFWLTLITWPWTVKFLWSPFLEMFKNKKFFILATQLISAVGFGLIALTLQMPYPFALSVAVLALVAVSGATYDIAADGLYMEELSTEQQTRYAGWMGAFYNLAKLVVVGLLVYLAGVFIEYYAASLAGLDVSTAEQMLHQGTLASEVKHQATLYGWATMMGICALMLLLLAIYHARVLPKGKEAQVETKSAREVFSHMGRVIALFFQKKYIFYYIAWIICYRLCEGFVMRVAPLFLKAPVSEGGLGLTEQQIGLYYGGFGPGSFVIGSLLAASFIGKLGLRRAIFILCCLFNFSFGVYAYLAVAQPSSMWIIGSSIAVEWFCYGFGFVGLSLFMMQQIAKGENQMSHYAFATGLMNLAVMLPGMWSGRMSDALGYQSFFLIVMLAVIPACILTWLLPFTHKDMPDHA